MTKQNPRENLTRIKLKNPVHLRQQVNGIRDRLPSKKRIIAQPTRVL